MREPELKPLVEYCIQKKLSWAAGYRLLLIGQLEGEKVGGRWFVRPTSQAPATRTRVGV